MCWQMKEIFEKILELTSMKPRWYIQIITIVSEELNNLPCWAYSVHEPQVKRNAYWKIITV